MGVIVILGRAQDPVCRLVEQQFVERNREFLLLPEDRVLPGLDFAWTPADPGRGGRLRYAGREIDFAAIDGILSRAWGVPIAAQDFATIDGRYICTEWNALLMAWLSAMPCTVVNRLRPELWYKTALNAADLAALVPELPFKLPRSLVTTRIDDARAFCRSARDLVRYSPLTRAAHYPIKGEADRAKLADLAGSLPIYLTEIVSGRAIEAFVAGSTVTFVDGNGRLLQDEPEAIAVHCDAVAQALGLAFCKLSLLAAAGGAWYCLGLDRTPQLNLCGGEAQSEITNALADVVCCAEPQK